MPAAVIKSTDKKRLVSTLILETPLKIALSDATVAAADDVAASYITKSRRGTDGKGPSD